DRDRSMLDAIREGRPLDQLHHERTNTVRLFEAVDVGDVGMVQCGERSGFPLEPGDAFRIRRKRLREDLDRYVAIQLPITRTIDLSHTTSTNGGENLVGTDTGAGRH